MIDITTELSKIITYIKNVAMPEQIILFGSAARGTMKTGSDLDILVVKKGDYNARELAGEIYSIMEDVNISVDILIVTPDQLIENKDLKWSAIYPALKEGRIMYERKTVSI